MWKKDTVFLRDTAGNPEQARWCYLAWVANRNVRFD